MSAFRMCHINQGASPAPLENLPMLSALHPNLYTTDGHLTCSICSLGSRLHRLDLEGVQT